VVDLAGERVASDGQPVEFFGELADDSAGGLLGGSGDGLGVERLIFRV